jgi:hypothetical protein
MVWGLEVRRSSVFGCSWLLCNGGHDACPFKEGGYGIQNGDPSGDLLGLLPRPIENYTSIVPMEGFHYPLYTSKSSHEPPQLSYYSVVLFL